jgi:hypothetical protein
MDVDMIIDNDAMVRVVQHSSLFAEVPESMKGRCP